VQPLAILNRVALNVVVELRPWVGLARRRALEQSRVGRARLDAEDVVGNKTNDLAVDVDAVLAESRGRRAGLL